MVRASYLPFGKAFLVTFKFRFQHLWEAKLALSEQLVQLESN